MLHPFFDFLLPSLVAFLIGLIIAWMIWGQRTTDA